jgi:transcriptional regulator with GAF, ATPase, and Fis domain
MSAVVRPIPIYRPPASPQGELIGAHQGLRDVCAAIRMVARTDASVLIQGETGTGKELVAGAIHEESLRSQGPFVKLNCAAVPADLLESELFGHERGAFTGAYHETMGRFQRANGGTLLLDEIGELPLELQPKLLRVLQQQEFERVGGSQTIRVDVRIVAATNRDLEQMMYAGRFRADLYYRLNVFPIGVPPLRDRRRDIPLLARHFVKVFAQRVNRCSMDIPEGVMKALERHNWPGNIRELQNVIERSVIMSTGKELQFAEGAFRPGRHGAEPPARRTLAECERGHILQTLTDTNWVVGGRDGAAARLGIARTTLIHKMKKLRIEPGAPEALAASV